MLVGFTNIIIIIFPQFTAGQTMAQRICRQITAQTNRIKQAVLQYNNLDAPNECKYPNQVTLTEAYDIKATLWCHLEDAQSLVTNGVIPVTVKRALIDHHHMIRRCDEERQLLEEEMQRTLNFYKNKIRTLQGSVAKLESSTEKYNVGLCGLLKAKINELKAFIHHQHSMFNKAGVTLPPLTTQFEPYTTIDDDSHSSEPDIDSEGSHVDSDVASDGDESEEGECEEDEYEDPLDPLLNALSAYEDPLSSAESDIE